MVLPLELLQQFKSSDFTDQEEYEASLRRSRKLKNQLQHQLLLPTF